MTQKTKNKKEVVFFEVKTFGDIIGAPFYFLAQEFKMFAGTLLKYAAPFVAVSLLIIALLGNNIYLSATAGTDFSGISVFYMLVLVLSFALGTVSVTTVTHSYITLYVTKGKGGFTRDDVGELLKENVLKIFFAGLLTYLIIFVGILFFYVPGIYFSVALSFVFIIVVYEKSSAGNSISRSMQVIKGNWWKTFGLVIVFGFIIGAMSYVFIIPIYAVIIVAAVKGKEIGAGSAVFITFFVFLYFTAYMFFISMQQIMLAFQYFSIRTEKEAIHLKDKIAAINDTEEETNEEKISEEEITKEDVENESIKESEKTEKNRFTEDDDYNRFKPKD